MCCDTKQKIAQALRQLMLERPLKKITVQDLMERTQMKRQTFYYHFQDIYDVLAYYGMFLLNIPFVLSLWLFSPVGMRSALFKKW